MILKEIDHKLFKMINQDFSNPFFDTIFPFLTDIQKSVFFYVFMASIIGILLFKRNFKSMLIIFSCGAGVLLVDLLNSKFLKPFFERDRPINRILRTDHHGSFSFPSSHATDIFFIAMVLGLYFPKLRLVMFILAGSIASSRIYCGVHYPGDVLAGAIVGVLAGYVFFKITALVETKLTLKKLYNYD